MDDVIAAHSLIRMLDLTSLNDNDSEFTIEELCQKACTPYGNVAAVCISGKFVELAKNLLAKTSIKIATVVNFPQGNFALPQTLKEIETAIKNGANEIDAVFPYKHFLEGNITDCENYVAETKKAVGKERLLKIILETGELKTVNAITSASKLCIANGADFIKTSTGKSPISATPEAANIMLEAIAAAKNNVGFKASGGIKTLEEAKKYLILADSIMGLRWINPNNFRIGASSLLNDLIAVIKRGY